MSTTESPSNFDNLEQMSLTDLLKYMNQEDISVPHAVKKVIPQIEALVSQIVVKMKAGGRLFYIGAGTSGRLGILDASEIPPTYGMPDNQVIGIIAGGDEAIRKSVEYAEDDDRQAWKDLKAFNINNNDVLIGIAASGRTPYVIGGIKNARAENLVTGCIVCNVNSALAAVSEYPIEAVVGPEFVTGSTRMKSGTAQKLILNMISTSTMIKLDKVKGNKMVDMQLTNEKLVDRGVKMIMSSLNIDESEAQGLLQKHSSVRAAIENHN